MARPQRPLQHCQERPALRQLGEVGRSSQPTARRSARAGETEVACEVGAPSQRVALLESKTWAAEPLPAQAPPDNPVTPTVLHVKTFAYAKQDCQLLQGSRG